MRNYIIDIKNKMFAYDSNSMNDFDYATIGSLVVGVADVIWLGHDIIANGLGTAYSFVALFLLMGNMMAAYGLHIHHKRAMFHRARRRQLRQDKEDKIIKELVDEQDELL